jgi:hypothetical protein
MKKCSIFVERSSTMEQSYDQPPPQKMEMVVSMRTTIPARICPRRVETII